MTSNWVFRQLYLLQSLEEKVTIKAEGEKESERELLEMALRFRQNNFPYARNTFLLTF